MSSFRVAGYLPDYRIAEFDLESADQLTDLIICSAELAADGSIDLTRLKDCPWPRLLEFKTRHRVRLLLTIGGWERSKHFAAVAASPEKRRQSVDSLVRLCLDKRLDGIDLDWEQPKGASEEEAYGKLLRELRTAFTPHGLMLSATIGPWQRLPASAVKAVDWVQFMAYDYGGKHSTAEQVSKDLAKMIDAGLPANKVILGLPFYGRDVETRKAMTYSEIATTLRPKPNQDQVGTMYFNGPDTIRRKVKLAIDSKLAGVMVWELAQDARRPSSLLDVIHETARLETKKEENLRDAPSEQDH
ncbi:MAG: glycoside hydrolase family 18 protein [Planctomycetota bacterium]